MQKELLFETVDMLGSPYEAFIFDTNRYQLPAKPHWHYFVEFIYLVQGAVLIECDNGNYPMEAGDMNFFYPRMMHSIYAATQDRIIYYVLKFDINRLDLESFSLPKFSVLFEYARHDSSIPVLLQKEDIKNIPFADCFITCIEEISQKNYGFDLLVHSAIYRILAEVIRYWQGLGFHFATSIPVENDIRSFDRILEYIDAHATESLKVSDLAAMCNISYSFFAKRFKELYGRSCKEYIEFVRVCKAETLLLFSNDDLSSISQETGFSDCSHLIKTFKKWKGVTPKQYGLHFQR